MSSAFYTSAYIKAVVISVCLLTVVGLGQNNKSLTNADIIQMVQEDVDESIILRAINNSEINFDISPVGLIQLKRGKVKKQIIEAVQNAQLRKNFSRSSSNSTDTKQTVSEASPRSTPTPAPSPTPIPTPIAIKETQLFAFGLEKCTISGRTVFCYFQITNNGEDRRLAIGENSSRLIDNEGNSARMTHVKVANNEYDPYTFIPSKVTVKSVMQFEGVEPTAQYISRFVLRVEANPGESVDLEFSNISFDKTLKR